MIILDTSRDTLLQAVQVVVGIVERRHTLPILGHVLIRKTGAQVTFTTTDLECQVSTQAEIGSGRGDIATTVAAHKLTEILRALPADQALTLTATKARLTLQAGKSRFTLQTLPAEDFPAGRAADAGPAWRLPQAVLAGLLDRVAFAMASHDIRYYLNGVLVTAEGRRLTVVATDGNRLAVAHAELAQDMERQEFILPRKTVLELQRLLRSSTEGADGAEGEVAISLSSAQARFAFSGISFISKLIEGKFPDYQRVIPKGNEQLVTVGRAALLTSLERAALLTSDKFRGVRLTLAANLLRITASNAAQEEALEELTVDHTGPNLEIGLNVAYVIDLLAHSSAETVQLAFRDAQASVLFTLPDQPDFAYVLSPMRL